MKEKGNEDIAKKDILDDPKSPLMAIVLSVVVIFIVIVARQKYEIFYYVSILIAGSIVLILGLGNGIAQIIKYFRPKMDILILTIAFFALLGGPLGIIAGIMQRGTNEGIVILTIGAITVLFGLSGLILELCKKNTQKCT